MTGQKKPTSYRRVNPVLSLNICHSNTHRNNHSFSRSMCLGNRTRKRDECGSSSLNKIMPPSKDNIYSEFDIHDAMLLELS